MTSASFTPEERGPGRPPSHRTRITTRLWALGQRSISYQKRESTYSTYGNAVEPVQDAGQVYDRRMQRVISICGSASHRPATDLDQMREALARRTRATVEVYPFMDLARLGRN
ncbi:MAG: hypothetical protein OXR73_34105 [Myxococcales bacterium]|nr:hypothetical protein [Myxococcales bacterium]